LACITSLLAFNRPTHSRKRSLSLQHNLQWGGTIKVIALITDYAAVDRIIDHLKLTFVADRLPPAHLAYQEVLIAVEASAEYFS
jgi:hypothetical protein